MADDTVLVADGGLATELEAPGNDLSDSLWSARSPDGFGGQGGLRELQCGPFGAGEVGGVPLGRHGGDALVWFPGLAQVAGYPDGVVCVAGDLPGAQLHQVDGVPQDGAVRWPRTGLRRPWGLANAPSSPGF